MDGGRVFTDLIEHAHGKPGVIKRPYGPFDVAGFLDARIGDQQDPRPAVRLGDLAQMREVSSAEDDLHARAGDRLGMLAVGRNHGNSAAASGSGWPS